MIRLEYTNNFGETVSEETRSNLERGWTTYWGDCLIDIISTLERDNYKVKHFSKYVDICELELREVIFKIMDDSLQVADSEGNRYATHRVAYTNGARTIYIMTII